MRDATDILISVDGRHAENLLRGSKTVELRRRRVSVRTGDRVWIYSKMPEGSIVAMGIVRAVSLAAPASIWETYGIKTGISQAEFFAYYADIETGCVIEFEAIKPVKPAVPLAQVKTKVSSFQPPQFFHRLLAGNPILEMLEATLLPA